MNRMDCKKYQKLYKNQEQKVCYFLLELFMKNQSNKELMKFLSWFQNLQHFCQEMSLNVKLSQNLNHWYTLDIKLFVEQPSSRKTWITQRKKTLFFEFLEQMQTQQHLNVLKEGSKSKLTQIKTSWIMQLKSLNLTTHLIL
mgnify:CR=1 FL=1